jgi:hypothetical protein
MVKLVVEFKALGFFNAQAVQSGLAILINKIGTLTAEKVWELNDDNGFVLDFLKL